MSAVLAKSFFATVNKIGDNTACVEGDAFARWNLVATHKQEVSGTNISDGQIDLEYLQEPAGYLASIGLTQWGIQSSA
jgi:hypothetical protein